MDGAIGASFGIALLALASCAGTSNRCTDVECWQDAATVCDPADGQCKCGASLSGAVVCPANTACDPGSFTCVSTLCAGVICGPTGSCDPNDGECKCGGEICSSDQVCDQDAGAKCRP